jgi:activating signal cointegrator 1
MVSTNKRKETGMQQASPSLAHTQLYTTLLKQDRVNVISMTEPWGTLLSTGAKRNETRSWPARLSYNGPTYRGPLAIHLPKRMDDSICFEEPFAKALAAAGYQPRHHSRSGNRWGLPLGHIIAVAWLESVWQINEHTQDRMRSLESTEYAFGNYQPGRFVWTFSCSYRLSKPIPMRGALYIWQWTPPEDFWKEIQVQADQLRLQMDE